VNNRTLTNPRAKGRFGERKGEVKKQLAPTLAFIDKTLFGTKGTVVFVSLTKFLVLNPSVQPGVNIYMQGKEREVE
jgi:hypothetical protein